MKQKQNIRLYLIVGLVFVSIGGFLPHLKIHSPMDDAVNFVPFIAGLLSMLVITGLFLYKRTIAYAYVLNGMIVIIGSIMMAHFSLKHLPHEVTVQSIFFGTLLGSTIILLSKFTIGKALFEIELFKDAEAMKRRGRFWRYPNMGWWWVHAVALSFVYVLGNVLWK